MIIFCKEFTSSKVTFSCAGLRTFSFNVWPNSDAYLKSKTKTKSVIFSFKQKKTTTQPTIWADRFLSSISKNTRSLKLWFVQAGRAESTHSTGLRKTNQDQKRVAEGCWGCPEPKQNLTLHSRSRSNGSTSNSLRTAPCWAHSWEFGKKSTSFTLIFSCSPSLTSHVELHLIIFHQFFCLQCCWCCLLMTSQWFLSHTQEAMLWQKTSTISFQAAGRQGEETTHFRTSLTAQHKMHKDPG